MWNIENILSGKKNKKIEIKKIPNGKFNPYSQGRVELKRKKMKEGLDKKFSDEFYQKTSARYLRIKGVKKNEGEEEEEIEESEGQLLYEKQREYYLKMLGDEKINYLEDLTNLVIQKEQQFINENDQKNFEDN